MLTEQKGDSHVQTADSLGFCSILLSATMLNTIWGKHFFFFWLNKVMQHEANDGAAS